MMIYHIFSRVLRVVVLRVVVLRVVVLRVVVLRVGMRVCNILIP